MKREKEILIKKKDWEKITKLIGEVYDRADKLYDTFGGVDKVYRELGRYAENLKGKISEINEQKREARPVLESVWEGGFHSGIGFVDDELGEWISEGISTRIDDGTFGSNYDWDKQVAKDIKRGKKELVLGGSK
jgi:hypothetical protein